MPPSHLLDALQWSITLSGAAAFVLSMVSLSAALRERAALRRSGQNGALAASVRLHSITATTRALAASLTVGGGTWLIVLPDFAVLAGVVAGCCWLAYNLLLIVNLSVEWWARGRMSAALDAKESVAIVDEMIMQRIERTAERLERTAERLERQHEREERR